LADFAAVTYSPNIPFIAEKAPSTLHLDPNQWIPDHALGLYFRCSMTAYFLAGLPGSSARSRSLPDPDDWLYPLPQSSSAEGSMSSSPILTSASLYLRQSLSPAWPG